MLDAVKALRIESLPPLLLALRLSEDSVVRDPGLGSRLVCTVRGLKPPPVPGLMYGDAESQSSACAPLPPMCSKQGTAGYDIPMRTNGCCIPRLVFRIPRIEVVVMIRERHENPRACLLVSRDQLVGVPIQQCPLCAEVLVSKARCRAIMVEVILVLPLSFNVHVARVPVTSLGYALRSPVRPDSELGIAIPVRSFVLEQ